MTMHIRTIPALRLAGAGIALVCMLWASAWAQSGSPSTADKKTGAAAEDVRTVEPFEAIVLRGGVDLVLRQATTPGVRVSADPADVARVETRVVQRGGRATLEIDQRPARQWSTRRTPVVTVDWTTLSALTVQGQGDVTAESLATPAFKLKLQGSGDVSLRRIDTRDLAISVAGSGDVHASGRAAALAISVAGSGDVDAAALEADTVSVTIAGSGDVSVKAGQTLNARIAGSGDIRYTGNPQVQSRVAGSGSVERR